MSHAFADIAFTPSVKAAQQRDGSRAGYARSFEGDAPAFNDRLGEAELEFIAAQRSFYMATVSETGWPYVQHRGGPKGFLKSLDDRTPGLCRLRRQPAAHQRGQPGRERPRGADPGGLRAARAPQAARSSGREGPGDRRCAGQGTDRPGPTARGRNAPWSSPSRATTGTARSTSRSASMQKMCSGHSTSGTSASSRWKARLAALAGQAGEHAT